MVGHRLAGDQAASAESGRDAALKNREHFAPAAASTAGARNTASIPGLSDRSLRPAPSSSNTTFVLSSARRENPEQPDSRHAGDAQLPMELRDEVGEVDGYGTAVTAIRPTSWRLARQDEPRQGGSRHALAPGPPGSAAAPLRARHAPVAPGRRPAVPCLCLPRIGPVLWLTVNRSLRITSARRDPRALPATTAARRAR
jgi:hypothetical protein